MAIFLVLIVILIFNNSTAYAAVNSAAPITGQEEEVLKGQIEQNQYPELEKRLKELLDIAEKNDSDNEFLKSKKIHFNKCFSKTWAGAKDIGELATAYRGFEQSSEAGDIILGEKLKIKSKASANYANQIKRDRTETDTYLALILMAEGIGSNSDAEQKEIIAKSTSLLSELVGDEEANKTLQFIKDWNASLTAHSNLSSQKPWNFLESKKQEKIVLSNAVNSDETIAQIKGIVHKKYNRRSNIARLTSKILNTTLSIGGLTPTIIGTACQCAWIVYIATQGGPEESKLLKEVYLAKSLESRCVTLSEYANLSVHGHNMGITTGNKTMLAFSDWMINRYSRNNRSENVSAKNIVVQNPSVENTVMEVDCAIVSDTVSTK